LPFHSFGLLVCEEEKEETMEKKGREESVLEPEEADSFGQPRRKRREGSLEEGKMELERLKRLLLYRKERVKGKKTEKKRSTDARTIMGVAAPASRHVAEVEEGEEKKQREKGKGKGGGPVLFATSTPCGTAGKGNERKKKGMVKYKRPPHYLLTRGMALGGNGEEEEKQQQKKKRKALFSCLLYIAFPSH